MFEKIFSDICRNLSVSGDGQRRFPRIDGVVRRSAQSTERIQDICRLTVGVSVAWPPSVTGRADSTAALTTRQKALFCPASPSDDAHSPALFPLHDTCGKNVLKRASVFTARVIPSRRQTPVFLRPQGFRFCRFPALTDACRSEPCLRLFL